MAKGRHGLLHSGSSIEGLKGGIVVMSSGKDYVPIKSAILSLGADIGRPRWNRVIGSMLSSRSGSSRSGSSRSGSVKVGVGPSRSGVRLQGPRSGVRLEISSLHIARSGAASTIDISSLAPTAPWPRRHRDGMAPTAMRTDLMKWPRMLLSALVLVLRAFFTCPCPWCTTGYGCCYQGHQ